jgi:hypothetical protein
MAYQHIQVPSDGEKISVEIPSDADSVGSLNVPNRPIIPYIEGDGIGVDITPVMKDVLDAAVPRPTAASAASPGWRSTPARSPPVSTARTSGCRTRRWKR